MRWPSLPVVSLLVFLGAQLFGKCDGSGVIASFLSDFVRFWFSPTTAQVVLLCTTPAFLDSENSTMLSIKDEDTLLQSAIVHASDLSIQYSSFFVRHVQILYTFQSELVDPVSTTLETTDSTPPFTLFNGDTNAKNASSVNLTIVGVHSVSITASSWWGIPLGLDVTLQWRVVSNIAEAPSGTPFVSSSSPVFVPISPFDAPAVPVVAPMSESSFPFAPLSPSSVRIVGELRIWHKVTLVFPDGPQTDEAATPNPFTDFYRLDVTFRNGNVALTVPGYYAADGNAAHASATSGSVWHCHLAPTSTGTWTWQASFRAGPNVAMDLPGSVSGLAMQPIDGLTGAFVVLPTDKTGVDLRGKGLLRYVEGKHHLQFAGNGEWFLKVGADSPENFLAFDDFDNTPNIGGRRKSWSPHVQDFIASDPTWANGKGKGIIGAVNYLSNQGMRSFSFLTMSAGGDDGNVYPYINPMDRLRFDVSKLAQWEVVFEHADRKGMYLHFKTQETENDQLLDSGALADERKLYYRELVARFSHHLALNWNIGEENTNTPEQQKAFADRFKAIDPYKHPVVIHTFSNEQDFVYQALYGYPSYDGASLQSPVGRVFSDTLARVQESAASGRTWVVSNDEQGSAEMGVLPDSVDPNHDTIRRLALWGNMMVSSAVPFYVVVA
jgi:Domain of unknown function (DUF5060)